MAGPGTGKTRTLTHRMARLVQDRRVSAGEMLAVTFTAKAAEEMRSRLSQLLGEDAPLPMTTTFHALCWTLIKEEKDLVAFRIIDDADRQFIMQRLLRRLHRAGEAVTLKPRMILARILEAKQLLQGPEVYHESVATDAPASQFARAYKAYQNLLDDQHLLDFEDLIFTVVRRMERDSSYRKKCRKRFAYVFVDEYQDLNHGQYQFIRALVPAEGNLCVIGDPDQAIYGFRGSDVAYFNRFVEDFPGARVIHLTHNYRSAETILEASWQVIRHGASRTDGLGMLGARLHSHLAGAPQVAVIEMPSEKAEAVAVGQIIEKAVGGAGFLAIDAGKVDPSSRHDFSFADFAVLYRTTAQSDIFAEMFEKAGIPFQTASRRKYYEQPAVAALLSLLRIATRTSNTHDLVRLAHILRPTLDKETVMAFLDGLETAGLPLHQALDQAPPALWEGIPFRRQRRLVAALDNLKQLLTDVAPLCLEDRIRCFLEDRTMHGEGELPAVRSEDAVERLVAHARRCQGDPERFLTSLALHTDADMVQPRVEKVTLTTMHAAKGLEFPVVFVAGCEDGLVPLRREGREPSDLDEERRLFYVALTRARERLYLTWSRKRRIYGRQTERTISPFVGDIERKLLRHQAPRLTGGRPGPQQVQLKLF